MAANKDDTRQWFLRINGETIFGPVSTQGLILWAEQGRILPGHEVSTDRKTWLQAVGVDLLGMRWFVDDKQGDLRGPLNRLAAEALLKSGKVPEDSRLVEAGDEDAPKGASGASEEENATHATTMPEDILRRRISELESMVNDQRARLTKLSDADAIEAIQQERDVLSTLLKEAEGQSDDFKRTVEKETRANQRQQEALRQQIKKLEQQCEETGNQLRLLNEAAESREKDTLEKATKLAVIARQEAVSQAQHEKEVREEALRRETEALRIKLAESEQALAEACNACEIRLENMTTEVDDFKAQVAVLEDRQRTAEKRVAVSEAAFAELLNDANTRDQEYREKIETLEKDSAQSPEERARFYADQEAVYELVKAEVSELSESMEKERAHIEQLKELSFQRQQKLMARRQKLLKHLGGSPNEMARRAGREQPSDAQVARLRADFENLRVTHQRELKFAETKEREYQETIEGLEVEANRLKMQGVEFEKNAQKLMEAHELLQQLEPELAEERKLREAEREQFQSNQRALLTRIDQLERNCRTGGTPEVLQATEARSVKLASWMRLKR